ncbi:MAG: BatD family protein [Planctomycetota bacterium]
MSIINGKTTQNIKKRYIMSYLLAFNNVGKIELPSVTVTIDGKRYGTNPVNVNILKPGTTD